MVNENGRATPRAENTHRDGHAQGKDDEHWSDLYGQVCTSYHAIEQMRLKLLSFLPLSSGAGIFLLLTTPGASPATASAVHTFLTPIGAVGACITVGLFTYELRATQNSIALTTAGKQLERVAGTSGAFTALPHSFGYIINYLFAAVLIYSAVFAGWVYVAVNPWLNAQDALWVAIGSYSVPVAMAILVQFVLRWALRGVIAERTPIYTIPNLDAWFPRATASSATPHEAVALPGEAPTPGDRPANRLDKKVTAGVEGQPVLFTGNEVNTLARRAGVSRDELLVGAP